MRELLNALCDIGLSVCILILTVRVSELERKLKND